MHGKEERVHTSSSIGLACFFTTGALLNPLGACSPSGKYFSYSSTSFPDFLQLQNEHKSKRGPREREEVVL